MGTTSRVDQRDLGLRAAKDRVTGRGGRRVGYVFAIVINAAMIYVANNLLRWDLIPVLTDDFDRVLPAINLSLAVTIVVNVLRFAYDAPWFTRVTEIISLAFSIAAALRLYRIFPLDFDQHSVVWESLIRLVLIVAIVGSAIAIVVQLVRLVTAPDDRS